MALFDPGARPNYLATFVHTPGKSRAAVPRTWEETAWRTDTNDNLTRMHEIDRFVHSFLSSARLPRKVSHDRFWKQLHKRHGDIAIELNEAIVARAEGRGSLDVYKLKNRNLDLSLAVTGQFVEGLYRSYLAWFCRESFPEPARILDVGCDNGVLACFYAKRFPRAHVLGIDVAPEAVECARELAASLKLTNVEFRTSDVRHIGTELPPQTQDLVVGTMVLCDALGPPRLDYTWSLREQSIPDAPEWTQALSALSRLLTTDGFLISIERMKGVQETTWLVRSLNHAAFGLDWSKSYVLEFDGPEEKERVPLLVARAGSPQPSTLDDVLAFHIYRNLADRASRDSFDGDVAEALFEAFARDSLLFGCEAVYRNGSGTERCELWSAGALILAYTFTNRGYRRLTIVSRTVRDEVEQSVTGEFEQKRGFAEVRSYRSLAERDTE
jgi:SAM-dependent methyltransferase